MANIFKFISILVSMGPELKEIINDVINFLNEIKRQLEQPTALSERDYTSMGESLATQFPKVAEAINPPTMAGVGAAGFLSDFLKDLDVEKIVKLIEVFFKFKDMFGLDE